MDNQFGRVFVFYYDQGVAESGDLTQVAFTYSDDGGLRWTKPAPLTNSPFRAGWGNDTGQPNLGDYNQGVAKWGKLYSVWAGTYQVGFTDGQPATQLTVPDVFFRKVPSSTQAVDLPVSAGIHAGPTPIHPSANLQATTLLEENFDEPGLSLGTLPPTWRVVHGAGANVVPWVTDDSFCGTRSNVAFHVNANDGLPPDANVDSSPARWERLLSPVFSEPANADLVTVDFDACYDTEDDPNFNILAYDGFFLRVTDLTPGRTVRSVLAETFEKEFTTGNLQHYPKHLPRSNDPAYFEDMSAGRETLLDLNMCI